jgi:photosystem II stability/assembly factor-like uncharacterized protein
MRTIQERCTFALQVGYMVRTDDGGKSWDLIDNGLDADVHTIVTDPSSFERLTIATGGHDCRAGRAPGRALYASQDGGQSWETLEVRLPAVISDLKCVTA